MMRRRISSISFRGAVALILALGVSCSIVLLVIETMLHRGAISEAESSILSTVLGAAIGAIATYLGGNMSDAIINPKDDDKDEA